MNRHQLICRLIALPAAIGEAEAELVAAEWGRTTAAAGLQAREDELLVAGVEGKNSDIRQALVRQHSEAERNLLMAAEQTVGQIRSRLRCLNVEASCLKAVGRLIGGAE